MTREARRRKLLDLADRLGLAAIVLRRPANFAWYTGGADNRVDHASPLGVADIVITPDAELVVTDNIEAGRMREEQTPDLEVAEFPWHQGPGGFLRELTNGGIWGADAPMENVVRDVSEEIAPLRYVLDAEALESYRRVGADAAAALEEAAEGLGPESDELEAAAGIAFACRRRGLFAPLAMAAAGERLLRYRHPVSHGGRLGSRAMLVVCAERGGLYANLTRMLDFEEQDAETRRRQEACEEILRRMREATRPGRTLGEIFEDCRRFYAEVGFPDEWRLHHQGGLTGYASREVISVPDADLEVEPGMAFAWNPSITGAKAEETFILTDSGPEVVTG